MLAPRAPAVSGSQAGASAPGEREPFTGLRRDPTYRREGPGKSPMAWTWCRSLFQKQAAPPPGVIRIAPEVVNNPGSARREWAMRPPPAAIRTVGICAVRRGPAGAYSPAGTGLIEKLYVKASGDPVTAGTAPYELYSPELVNAQEELSCWHCRR